MSGNHTQHALHHMTLLSFLFFLGHPYILTIFLENFYPFLLIIVIVYRMRFNFHGVYILRICNFCVFRVFKFVVAGYSGVEIFADVQSESVYHNSIRYLRRCKTCWTHCWICLKMSSY